MYIDLVMGLNFAVDFFLLLGAERLAGHPFHLGRSAVAALIGGVYGGVCLLPGFRFLGSTLWRMVFLAIMAAVAFGISYSGVRRGVLFVLLSMALGGIAVGMGRGGIGIVGAAALLMVLCVFGFRRGHPSQRFATVELTLGDKKRRITALYDTGNTLSDPVSGKPVLVVGAGIAREMAGLTAAELADPITTMAKSGITGLRLIPYKAVGQPAGMLLAIRMDEVRIDGKAQDILVAFAPHNLGDPEYEALAGGMA